MKEKNKLRWINYLLILAALNFSCTQPKSAEIKTDPLAKAKANTEVNAKVVENQLKYTSGIRYILHDSKGNYWFGSHQEGLCLFDGKSFKYFTVEDGLGDNQVRAIKEDKDGLIWLATGMGLSSYENGKIKSHASQNTMGGFPSAMKGSWDLKEEDLWFHAGNAAAVYRYADKKVSYLELPVQAADFRFNAYGNTGFSRSEKGKIWMATYAAVFGFDGEDFEIIDDASLGFTEETGRLHVRSILEDSKGNLWIGNNGIGVLLRSKDTFVHFSKEQGLIHANSSMTGRTSEPGTLEHVFAIAEDRHGNIWFGDRDTGAWKYDGESIENYVIDSHLKSPMIWNIYEDRAANLLFAMGDQGVYQFNGQSFERKF